MLTPTETPPTVTGGVLTGTGTAGSGTVTVVVLVVLVVDVVLPVFALPEPLAAGVVAVPPAEAVTGALDPLDSPSRLDTELPLPPRGSDGSVGEVEVEPPEPVPPVAP